MIHKLSDRVWFGDKPSVMEKKDSVQSVINVAHSIRRPYWQNLGKLDYHIWYFRLALQDQEEVTIEYLNAFSYVMNAISQAEKFPLLCHCRQGGHRGPSAALFAHWCLNGQEKAALFEGLSILQTIKPGYNRPNPRRFVYRDSILKYCMERSI